MEDFIIRGYRLFLIILIPLCVNLSQTINLQSLPNDNTHIGLTFDKAFYDGNNNYSLFSGVFQLFANTPISENLNLYGNIPFINMSSTKKFIILR